MEEEVHFKFVVESSTYNGEIMLTENYKLIDPDEKILLEVDESENFHFQKKSKETKELITFKDFLIIGEDLPTGEYTLNLVVENPLINKKTTLTKRFIRLHN